MLKLSKKVEYALLAVQHMASRQGSVISAKDVALRFDISLALIAKVLQSLVRAGLVVSYHGTNGGYALARPAAMISIADVIEAIEGRQGAIVNCQDHTAGDCCVSESCTIREPLSILQERITLTFATMTIAELAHPPAVQYITID
jgi:Rrf2 family protein